MAIEPGRVKALFKAAIELDDASERQAFLDHEIGGDIELRARLNALLAAYQEPGGILDQPLAAKIDQDSATARPIPHEATDRQDTTAGPSEAPAGLLDNVIAGRYKLRQEIGEGGMGTVYLAEQTQPVRRMVALKLRDIGDECTHPPGDNPPGGDAGEQRGGAHGAEDSGYPAENAPVHGRN